jgi:tetratricopeptide (TPR) repeat protein
MNAEQAYLFRHAMLRDAAYQLQPPSHRAALHKHALAILEQSVPAADLPLMAAELADHARLAGAGLASPEVELADKELEYMLMAADHAEEVYQNTRAIELHQRVAAHPRASTEQRASALLRAAVLWWFMGARTPAEQSFHAALKLETPDNIRAWCLVELGVMHRDLDEWEQAETHLRDALKHAKQCGDSRLELRALGNLTTVIDRKYSVDDAIELYQPVIALAEELGARAAVGICYGQIGVLNHRARRLPAAEVWTRRAIITSEESDDKLNAAAQYGTLAEVLLTGMREGGPTARINEAEEAAQKSLELNREIGAYLQLVNARLSLAECALVKGNTHEAESHARQGLELALEQGRPGQIAQAYQITAKVLEAQGRNAEAEQMHAKAKVAGGDLDDG